MAQCRDCHNAYRMVLHFNGPQKSKATCLLCGSSFVPASGRQERCSPCRPEWERIKKRRLLLDPAKREALRKRTADFKAANREMLSTNRKRRRLERKALAADAPAPRGGMTLAQIKIYNREYRKRWRAENPLRSRMSYAMRRGLSERDPKHHWLDALGYTIADLRQHIERQFVKGMTWDNIHIDHIIPCASFDLSDIEQQRRCFHFSNLQPLLAVENLQKGSSVSEEDLILNAVRWIFERQVKA